MARRQKPAEQPQFDEVDRASADSFPASDPPPWTLGRRRRFRGERDASGEAAAPGGALYGAQTRLAMENFQISALRLQRPFVTALGLIKASAARVNGEMGALPPKLAKAIERAAETLAAGQHYDAFVVDVFQTGSGTSTNMNANEVIGKLANAHPNDHVNRSQSSNDVIPAAIHVAAALRIHEGLLPAMELLQASLAEKAVEFRDVIKVGRTHLQDATPIRLGQEFSGYRSQVQKSMERVRFAMAGLYELPLGGTAVGTGIHAPDGFGKSICQLLAGRTGLPFREAENHFEAQAAKDAILIVSGVLRAYAIALTKIANDLRWMASGPRCGLSEIRLPELQPGSSIMPGKVNPVIPESVLMVCAQVIGHDATIAWGCASGNFELNTMMPLIAYDLLESIELLNIASRRLAQKCVAGIEVNQDKLGECAEQSLALATGLSLELGYDKAAEIAKAAFATGRTVREVAISQSGLSAARVDELFRSVGAK